MARIRTIKPIFWDDELVGSMGSTARLVFIGLISLADDEGRLPGRAVAVRNRLFLYDESVTVCDVEDALLDLHNARRIKLYGSVSQRYIEVVNFRAHQRISKPQKSQYPSPSRHYPTLPLECADEQGKDHAAHANSAREQVESPRLDLRGAGEIQEVLDMQDIPTPFRDQSDTSNGGNGMEGNGKERDTSTSDKPKRDLNAEAREVFDHWCRVWKKRTDTMFDTKRKGAVMRALRNGYTVDQLCEAISGYRFSDHHMGTNGKKFDELELFVRDAAHIEAGWAHGSSGAGSIDLAAWGLTGGAA